MCNRMVAVTEEVFDPKLSRRGRARAAGRTPTPAEAAGDLSPAVDQDDPNYVIVAGSTARALRCKVRHEGVWCIQPAARGTEVCQAHGADAGQVRAAHARRLATARAAKKLSDWGYDPVTDPFAAMADLAGRSVALVEAISAQLADGEVTVASVDALGQAIERAHRQAKDLASAGFEAARLRLEEAKVDLMDRIMRRAWAELGFDQDDPRVQGALEVAYREITE